MDDDSVIWLRVPNQDRDSFVGTYYRQVHNYMSERPNCSVHHADRKLCSWSMSRVVLGLSLLVTSIVYHRLYFPCMACMTVSVGIRAVIGTKPNTTANRHNATDICFTVPDVCVYSHSDRVRRMECRVWQRDSDILILLCTVYPIGGVFHDRGFAL